MKKWSTEMGVRGFSLAEAIIGIGMASVLILAIIAITTAALSGDQKAEARQVALALVDTELNRLARQVGVVGSPARTAFWEAPDGDYSGHGTQEVVTNNGTDFTLSYHVTTVLDDTTGAPLGLEKPANRLRKMDLTASWWEGEEGKPGYGRLSVRGTRLVRESDLYAP